MSLNRIDRSKARKVVRVLLVVFYLLSVALWFKDSISFLTGVPLSPLFGIVPLILLTVLRFVLRERGAGRKRWPIDRRDVVVLILILTATTLFRIPFLTHSFGLMNSDDAIVALMGKHIAEDRRPPIFFYGQFYLGSLVSHYGAIVFVLFGYSVFLAKLSAFLVYLVFICTHYVLMKKMLTFLPAVAAGAFFILPLPDLVTAGFDISSGFPHVLLFGSLIFLLAHAVVFENNLRPMPLLGLLMGLAFWTHQISFIFIVTTLLFLVPVFRRKWKSSVTLALFFIVGAFPVVLNELVWKFPLAKFLFPGGSGRADPLTLKRYKDLVLSLLVSDSTPLAEMVFVLLLAGSAGLVFLSIKNKKVHPAFLFVAFTVVFSIVYLISDFGRTGIIRYLYILYPAFPVLFGGLFLSLGKKLTAAALGVILLFILPVGNSVSHSNFISTVKEKHGLYATTLAAMEETGEKFWMAEYWVSYLLTALSAERMIVASTTTKRYFPYKLFYDSGRNSNMVINKNNPHNPLAERQAAGLAELLDSLKISYEFREVGTMALFYKVGSSLYPRFPFADPQEAWPDIVMEKFGLSEGRLELLFVKKNMVPAGGYRIHIEIPGYFSRFFPLPDKNRFSLFIPYPDRREFLVRHHLAYAGMEIPRTAVEKKIYALRPEDLIRPRRPVIFLAGIGPRRDIKGRPMYALRKSAALEIQIGEGTAERLTIHLDSPFEFSHPFWYGNYRQNVEISVNGMSYAERPLRDGDNALHFNISRPPFRPGSNRIDFVFRYAMVFSHQDLWKTSAYLDTITLE